ncbi:hypothetical protein [Flavobacterium hercynium]|uniref:Uncharacterized protein n=1 Tax=Flavobacterium hercynium TaxID=387094 RepID=A0A226H145_9FLAO|nr:hypothetical protein [Flavobacterium hercynium]OXA87381.1 hypothetical protein B0A66_16455 [Flavobacterium hercynium]SMP27356.1 hypothetical protein SAMN06265346_11084 [Flavobacterium hercynium]
MQEPKTKKKLTATIIIAVVIAAVSVSLIQYFFFKDAAKDTEVIELVAKYNKSCPLEIQPGIRLDSVSLPEGHTIQYNQTLVNVEKATAEIDTIKQNIQQSLISTVKANPGLQIFRDKEFVLIYHYNDRKKDSLFQIAITPEQYK